jgi:hypothetical protein
LFFGGAPEVNQIAGLDPSDSKVREKFISLIVDSVLRPSLRTGKRPA